MAFCGRLAIGLPGAFIPFRLDAPETPCKFSVPSVASERAEANKKFFHHRGTEKTKMKDFESIFGRAGQFSEPYCLQDKLTPQSHPTIRLPASS
jgi:hypothetical protein